MNFRSFWEVYNLLRDAVNSEFLFNKATANTIGEDAPEDSDDDLGDLPLHHLRPCQFGANGIPDMVNEGKQFFSYFRFYLNKPCPQTARRQDTLKWNSWTMKAMKYFSGFRYMSLFFIDK